MNRISKRLVPHSLHSLEKQLSLLSLLVFLSGQSGIAVYAATSATKVDSSAKAPLSPKAADSQSDTAGGGDAENEESSGIDEAAVPMAAISKTAPAPAKPADTSARVLKGRVQSEVQDSPLVEGKVQTIPKGTAVSLTLPKGLNLNSEFTQKGDDIWMRVSTNVPGADGVAVPGGWYAHGFVSEAKGQRRLNRDGYIEIEFKELVSPDGLTHVEFPAKISTKDSMMKSTLKQVATGTTYATIGATGGALISLQVTGIAGAIASHGISVGVGAAVGAGLGIFGAMKKKGKVANVYSDDDLKLTIAEPIVLPAFRPDKLPSAKPVPKLKNMSIAVHNFKFYKDPYGDPHSRILDVDITIANHTNKAYSAGQLRVLDDHQTEFTPYVGENIRQVMKKVEPGQEERINVMYEVNSDKRKYWLSLRENGTGMELSRVPVNVQN